MRSQKRRSCGLTSLTISTEIEYTEYLNGDIIVSKDKIDNIPTVEQKHGHWIKQKNKDCYIAYLV